MAMIRSRFKEYPYNGAFYRIGVDESKPPLEQVDEKIILFETVCDIQEVSHSDGAIIKADYAVYFPLDGELGLKNGYFFEGTMQGIVVNGKVSGIFPSQLGGVKVYVEDLDV